MQPPGSQGGAEIKKMAWGLFFTPEGGGSISRGVLATFTGTQTPVIS